MLGIGTLYPLIGMSPNSQLGFEPARCRLVGYKLHHFQVAVPFGVGQWNNSHPVSRNIEHVRIREMKIVADDMSRKVVAKTEGQSKTIEAVRGKISEIGAPQCFVVEPFLVLNVTYERARNAADRVGGCRFGSTRRVQS